MKTLENKIAEMEQMRQRENLDAEVELKQSVDALEAVKQQISKERAMQVSVGN